MDARTSLALWLRAGRAQRGISLEEVSRITKIQVRILERLEAGKVEGLPADVFVRGFVRSFAKCVGLDEDEALRRYHQCSNPAAVSPVSAHAAANPAARAVVEAMADLAPATANATRPARALTNPLAAGTAPELPTATELAVESEPRLAASLPVVAAPAPVEPIPAPVVVMLPETGTLAPGQGVAIASPPAVAVLAAPAPVAPVPVVEVAPVAASAPAVEAPIVVSTTLAAAVAEPAPPIVAKADASSKKKNRRHKRTKRNTARSQMAVGTPALASPVVVETPAEVEAVATPVDAVEAAPVDEAPSRPSIVTISELPAVALDASMDSTLDAAMLPSVDEVRDVAIEDPSFEEPIATATWQPRMPTVVAPTVPWRRPSHVTTTAAAPTVPSLVIDDADPDGAEQVREERAAHAQPRRTFLPPILLDREDRSARQGGLTLAVIILLIAATLTLSYLMRRPSSSGDGVTAIPSAIEHIG